MNVEEICRLMAKTWKDNGGDAMGFYWLQDIIRMEILNLEEGFTPREEPEKANADNGEAQS